VVGVTRFDHPPDPGSVVVRVSEVTVRFAGVVALDSVSFDVTAGQIQAIIGPNGAGKSTLFNVLSGVYRPTVGHVEYRGVRLDELRPDQIAYLGIGRTFQNIALFPHQSVEDNLMLGRHHLTSAGFVASALALPRVRREDRRHRARVREIAEFAGLAPLLRTPAGSLSYGDRKRVELARALCTEPDMLLLDEPVAGMNADETRRMAGNILDINEELGITVLLVEHDMGMVMSLAHRVVVLDFGQKIAEGDPATVQADPAVLAAYLGDFAAPAAGEETAR
jgi:branched-chain amino acid transport system ATP-binding protein